MKPGHTPAPWTAQCDKPGAPGTMALVITSAKAARTRAIDCTGSGETYAEDCANARLVAAAPNLLAALKSARTILWSLTEGLKKDECPGIWSTAEKCDRAITEAGG